MRVHAHAGSSKSHLKRNIHSTKKIFKHKNFKLCICDLRRLARVFEVADSCPRASICSLNKFWLSQTPYKQWFHKCTGKFQRSVEELWLTPFPSKTSKRVCCASGPRYGRSQWNISNLKFIQTLIVQCFSFFSNVSRPCMCRYPIMAMPHHPPAWNVETSTWARVSNL